MVFKQFSKDIIELSDNFYGLNVITDIQTQKLDGLIANTNALKENNLLSGDNLTSYFQSVAEGAENARVNIVDAYAAILDGNTHGLKNVQSIFNTYNNVLKGNEEDQKNFTKAVGQSNTSLSGYLTTVGTEGTASLKGYAGHLVKTTAKTVGLKVATLALKSVISLGLSTAIGFVISKITEAINAESELAEKTKELGNTAKTTSDEISSLYLKYIDLSKAVELGTGSKEELKSTTEELLKALGIEDTAVSELTKKYGSLKEAISNTSLEALKSAHGDLVSSIATYRKELLDVGGDGLFGQNNKIPVYFTTSNETDKELRKIVQSIRKLEGVKDDLGTFRGGSEFVLTLLGDANTVDGIKQNYETLVKIRDIIIEIVGAEKAGNLDLYNKINNRIGTLKTAYDNYTNEVNALNQNAAKTAILENLKGKELPKTEEEFEKFYDDLIQKATKAGSDIRQEFIGSDEEIKNSIEAALQNL